MLTITCQYEIIFFTLYVKHQNVINYVTLLVEKFVIVLVKSCT